MLTFKGKAIIQCRNFLKSDVDAVAEKQSFANMS